MFPGIAQAGVPGISRDQMVEVDRVMVEDLGIGLVQMMENAGRNLARLVFESYLKTGAADQVVVPDVYGAREVVGADANASGQDCGTGDSNALGTGSPAELVSRIRAAGGSAAYVPSLLAVTDHVANRVNQGDLVLVMGAGDVWKVADGLVERFCESD